jgi:small neutral amino acid transporter SnatA (MarC family)
MTVTLLVLASLAAANPFRAASASPTDDRPRAVAVAFSVSTLAVIVLAVTSAPMLDTIDITGSSARIAAGIALVAVSLKDVLTAPPKPEPALTGWKAGIVPLTIPATFSPAMALLAIAGGADRGAVVATAAIVPALLVAAVAALRPPPRGLRTAVVFVGAFGAAVAAFVVLDGVYSI